jgi:hypothetical protein
MSYKIDKHLKIAILYIFTREVTLSLDVGDIPNQKMRKIRYFYWIVRRGKNRGVMPNSPDESTFPGLSYA